MVMGLVSAAAIALAFGPQIQLSLQAVVDDAAGQTPAIEEVVTEASETTVKETPTVSLPIETIEETVIEQAPISEPVKDDPMISGNDIAAEVIPQVDDTVPVLATNDFVPQSEWPAILSDASDALAAARTARGDFIQTNADLSVVSGTFALNRPGRMRFDYDDPTPVLIVSDGTTVAMEDSELETVDRGPIGSTPLGLLLSTRLNVEQDVDVLRIARRGEEVDITVRDTSGELEGTLTMVFAGATYELMGWVTRDGNDQKTEVDLINVETNIRVDPRLFRINEDDNEEDER
ncbi:MAG: outer-membrane lipoprotein carrier protein LolA [Pseudomonadota bacterium]